MPDDPISTIKQHYADAIVEERDCPIASIRVFDAYEREWLAEDPLLPDRWYASELGIARNFDLGTMRHVPRTPDEAGDIARWIIRLRNEYATFRDTSITSQDGEGNYAVLVEADVSAVHPLFEDAAITLKQFAVNVLEGVWQVQEL